MENIVKVDFDRSGYITSSEGKPSGVYCGDLACSIKDNGSVLVFSKGSSTTTISEINVNDMAVFCKMYLHLIGDESVCDTKLISHNDALEIFSIWVRLNYKNQSEASEDIGISRSMLSQVLAGKRNITKKMLAAAGMESVVTFKGKK